MERPRTMTLAVCLTAVLAAPAFARFREPATLPDLIAELEAPPEVLFVFHPGDCRLGARAITALNRAAKLPGTRVQGVMLAPPVEPGAPEWLAGEFGIGFPVAFDHDGAWRTAVDAEGLRFPVVLVKQGSRYVRVGDPHAPGPLYSLVANTLNGRTDP